MSSCCNMRVWGTALCVGWSLQVAAVPGPTATPGVDWSRYQVILDREPFGHAPKTDEAGPELSGKTEPDPIPPGPTLAETVKLSVVTLYGGVPAAGFTDTTTGRSFYLFEGQSVEDFTLVSVDETGAGATLRKGPLEEHLQLGAPTAAPKAPVAPTATVAAVATPSDAISYAAKQRQRAEEARLRADEARRKADEDRKQQAANVERLTGEALQKHLREYNLQMIRTGQGPPLPIELTPDEVAQLASEGFDVAAPAGAPAPPSGAGLNGLPGAGRSASGAE